MILLLVRIGSRVRYPFYTLPEMDSKTAQTFAGGDPAAAAGAVLAHLRQTVQVWIDGDRVLPIDGLALLAALDQAQKGLAGEDSERERREGAGARSARTCPASGTPPERQGAASPGGHTRLCRVPAHCVGPPRPPERQGSAAAQGGGRAAGPGGGPRGAPGAAAESGITAFVGHVQALIEARVLAAEVGLPPIEAAAAMAALLSRADGESRALASGAAATSAAPLPDGPG